MKSLKTAFLLLLILLIVPNAYALEKVISNSADWKDVYSVMLYASLIEKQPGLFLTSAKHSTVLLYSISKDTDGILVVSSRSQPYIVNYKSVMDGQGYKDVEELVSNTINLDMGKRVVQEKNINKFIIVDDAYGYNALSVGSYAALAGYYVLFANERNIGQVDSFLGDSNPKEVIIFGQVDETVKTRLQKYNPETINKGDRFDNNIEIVKRYLQVKDTQQTLMSNGEFIEASIMSGQDPVIFIGKSTVPQQVQDYIKSSNFKVAVLIGNELIDSATAIRRQLGISVFVKFAQGARNPEGSIASVEDLDKFSMPKYSLNMELYSIIYNKATNTLWVTYHNLANLGTFVKGTITLTVNGQQIVVGDQDPIFIDKNQYKTFTYDVVLEGDNITAQVYTLFGEGKRSLENVLQGTIQVGVVEILDDSIINITSVVYDTNNKEFLVTLENIGTVDAYVNVELQDLFINGEYIIISSPETVLLKPGQKITLKVPTILSDSDIENNPVIKVKAYYGERENSLIKTSYGEFEFKERSVDYVFYILIVLVIILLLLILFGRKKCSNCGTKNSRTRKKCKKCGHNLYHKHKHVENQEKQA
jgi:archaellum component FlaF (FlaF/FlaG flagellin family)